MEQLQNFEVMSDRGDDNRFVVETHAQMVGMVVQMVLEAFADQNNREINIYVVKC